MTNLFLPLALATIAAAVVLLLSRRLRPQHGVVLTTASLVSVFLAALISLWAVGLGYLAHEPLTASVFAWCGETFGVHHRLSPWIGLSALGIATGSTVRGFNVVRSWRRLRGSKRAELQIVAMAEPVAFAQTGRHGGVVISTGMLEVLEPAERRALLAHEHAHLRHRHDRYLLVGDLATGLPPLMLLVQRLRHSLERWADEEAARIVGSREVVARAVAHAALASHGRPLEPLNALGANVPARVEALLRPPVAGFQASFWAAISATAVLVGLIASTVQLHHLALVASAICPG